MPTRFQNSLRKKGSSLRSITGHSHSRGKRTSHDSGVEKYQYGVDRPTDLVETKRRFSFSKTKFLDKVNLHRSSKSPGSSKSLGSAEVNVSLIGPPETTTDNECNEQGIDATTYQRSSAGMSFMDNDSNMSEEDDYFEEDVNNFINKKFSVTRNSDGSNDINANTYSNDNDYSNENDNKNNNNNNKLFGGNDTSDESHEEKSHDAGQELDRACVRMDGIEVYAIVSALTCATAISCFDNYEPTPLSEIIRDRAMFKLLAEFLYYWSGALGMMTGLHATLIFSLITMYGRTALGINRDEAFNSFFGNTGAARYNGFRSFRYSLYCFMTQLTFLIARKFFFEPLRPLVLLFTAYLSYDWLYFDSESVLTAAQVIYATPEAPEEEEVDKRLSSAKNKSFSLSTRNFGVDTTSQRRSSFVFANTVELLNYKKQFTSTIEPTTERQSGLSTIGRRKPARRTALVPKENSKHFGLWPWQWKQS